MAKPAWSGLSNPEAVPKALVTLLQCVSPGVNRTGFSISPEEQYLSEVLEQLI